MKVSRKGMTGLQLAHQGQPLTVRKIRIPRVASLHLDRSFGWKICRLHMKYHYPFSWLKKTFTHLREVTFTWVKMELIYTYKTDWKQPGNCDGCLTLKKICLMKLNSMSCTLKVLLNKLSSTTFPRNHELQYLLAFHSCSLWLTGFSTKKERTNHLGLKTSGN